MLIWCWWMLQSFYLLFWCSIPSFVHQEYEKYGRFTESLLSRASKLTELCQRLETALVDSGKSEDSSEGKRVSKYGAKLLWYPIHSQNGVLHSVENTHTIQQLRSVQALEAAVETLEAEYETCNTLKMDLKSLKDDTSLSPSEINELLD